MYSKIPFMYFNSCLEVYYHRQIKHTLKYIFRWNNGIMKNTREEYLPEKIALKHKRGILFQHPRRFFFTPTMQKNLENMFQILFSSVNSSKIYI
jgi:hypothetical protein